MFPIPYSAHLELPNDPRTIAEIAEFLKGVVLYNFSLIKIQVIKPFHLIWSVSEVNYIPCDLRLVSFPTRQMEVYALFCSSLRKNQASLLVLFLDLILSFGRRSRSTAA